MLVTTLDRTDDKKKCFIKNQIRNLSNYFQDKTCFTINQIYFIQLNNQLYLMGSSHPNIVYNIPVPDSKQPGFSSVYRCPRSPDRLLQTPQPSIKVVRDCIVESFLNKFPNNQCFGRINLTINEDKTESRTITNITFRQAFTRAQALGSYIIKNNLFSEADDTKLTGGKKMKLIGIYSKNSVEWGLVDIACILFGITIIPLYDTLGMQNLTHCLNHSKITTCFCTVATAESLLKLKDTGNLKNIVLLDLPKDKQTLENIKKQFNIFQFNQLIEKGSHEKINYESIKVLPQDCYTFSYTSGTTGPPKGAMISNKNVVAFLAAIRNNPELDFKPTDRYVSFLPLPHVMERVAFHGLLFHGANIVFYSGDVQKVKDDCLVVKPTIFVAVPRLFNRIVQTVQKKFQQTEGIKKCLADRAVSSKRTTMEQTGQYTSTFYDSLVFSKTKQAFGGCVRLLISGSAPLRKQVHEMMKIIMAAPLLEGYGQTQNVGAAFTQARLDPQLGHVGGILGSLQFKLQDIPEMNYSANDVNTKGQPTPKGEIWLRGNQVFMGYYKDPQKTSEALTSDGWLKTGDVGMIQYGTNSLKIIDRKKNIFKLQQGQYVASEKVEAIYSESHLVTQVFLHGQSNHIFCVAIITPNKEQLLKLASSIGIKEKDIQVIAKDKKVRTAFVKALDTIGKKQGLNGFQQAKNVYLQLQGFQARNILTNTFKLQRFSARKYYALQIEDMYQEGMLQIK